MDLGDKLIRDFLDKNEEQLLKDMESCNPMELHHAMKKVAKKTWELGWDFTAIKEATEEQRDRYTELVSDERLEHYIIEKARKYGEESLTEEEIRLTTHL